MQADQLRRLALIEVAPDSLAGPVVELYKVIGLGIDRVSYRARNEAAFRCFLHDEDDLAHDADDTPRWGGAMCSSWLTP